MIHLPFTAPRMFLSEWMVVEASPRPGSRIKVQTKFQCSSLEEAVSRAKGTRVKPGYQFYYHLVTEVTDKKKEHFVAHIFDDQGNEIFIDDSFNRIVAPFEGLEPELCRFALGDKVLFPDNNVLVEGVIGGLPLSPQRVQEGIARFRNALPENQGHNPYDTTDCSYRVDYGEGWHVHLFEYEILTS